MVIAENFLEVISPSQWYSGYQRHLFLWFYLRRVKHHTVKRIRQIPPKVFSFLTVSNYHYMTNSINITRSLEELIRENNSFLMANINFDGHYDFQSVDRGFENKTVIRMARIINFPNNEYLTFIRSIGYDIIVFDKSTLYSWFKKGGGKALFHIDIIKKCFPFILEPLPSINSARDGGFYSLDTDEGKILHRKKVSKSKRKSILKNYNNSCLLCGSSEKIELHHILERNYSGGTEEDNLVPLCHNCHVEIHSNDEKRMQLMPLRYRRIKEILKKELGN